MVINTLFIKGIGRLALDRYDFNKHIDGTDFRQKANTVDLNGPLANLGNATNVQEALDYINLIGLGGGGGGGVVNLSDLAATTGILPIVRGGTGLGTLGAGNTVFTSNGIAAVWATIVNANISSSAAIAASKLAPGSNGQVLQTIAGVTSWGAAPAGTPGGSDTQVQFNNGGVFGGAANVVYTSSKLRLSSNLQFINSGITGDLAWTPTSTNKTLTLPNATDTLVGKATTDTLTNKTIDSANNTITSTSIVAGDILLSNGTKYVRQGKGADGTFLGVTGGVVGYYTPAGGGGDGSTAFTATTTNLTPVTVFNLDTSAFSDGMYEMRFKARAFAHGGNISGITFEVCCLYTIISSGLSVHTPEIILSRGVDDSDIWTATALPDASGHVMQVVLTGVSSWIINWSGEVIVKSVLAAGTGND